MSIHRYNYRELRTYERLLEEGMLESIAATQWICYDYMTRKNIMDRSCVYFIEYQLEEDYFMRYAYLKIKDGTEFDVFEVAFWSVETAIELDNAYIRYSDEYYDYSNYPETRSLNIISGFFNQEIIDETLLSVRSLNE